MSRQEMQKALATGFNKQGRTMSLTMRVKYIASLSESKPEPVSIEYRGMEITGRPNATYFVDGLPQMMFTSVPKAKIAIDRCLEIREMMAGE